MQERVDTYCTAQHKRIIHSKVLNSSDPHVSSQPDDKQHEQCKRAADPKDGRVLRDCFHFWCDMLNPRQFLLKIVVGVDRTEAWV